jgi:hypothetical protein
LVGSGANKRARAERRTRGGRPGRLRWWAEKEGAAKTENKMPFLFFFNKQPQISFVE